MAKMNRFALSAALLLITGCAGESHYAFQDPAGDAPETKIPFVQYRGIRDWQAQSDRVLYAQGSDYQWYQVSLFGPCLDLEFANGVKFIPSDGAGDFDRFSSIATEGKTCKVASVKKVAPPTRVKGAKTPARSPVF